MAVRHPGALLSSDGKPEMFYVGAGYCPYCGAERWSMIVALSRFGRFTGLRTIRSSTEDEYPGTPTWTFYRTTFTSKYVAFTPVELYSSAPDGNGGFMPLQTLTRAQQAVFAKFDAPPYVQTAQYDESLPFVDFGNRYLVIGSSYSPGVLSGLSWAQIAANLTKPHTTVAKAVDGAANYITAALCELTRNQPSAACTRTIRTIESSLARKS
jgi:hypothetical protein